MENTNNEYKDTQWYKEEIVKMINNIHDVWLLNQIMIMIKNATKEG